jgi:hypothetical protein
MFLCVGGREPTGSANPEADSTSGCTPAIGAFVSISRGASIAPDCGGSSKQPARDLGFAIKGGSFGDDWQPCEDRLGIEAGSFVGHFAVPGIASVAVTLVRDA